MRADSNDRYDPTQRCRWNVDDDLEFLLRVLDARKRQVACGLVCGDEEHSCRRTPKLSNPHRLRLGFKVDHLGRFSRRLVAATRFRSARVMGRV